MIDSSADMVLCSCGLPLHYASAQTRRQIERLVETSGPFVVVTTREGSWWVPRHYVALHGLRAAELPNLAERYHWEKA
jgi:hypothetical protein